MKNREIEDSARFRKTEQGTETHAGTQILDKSICNMDAALSYSFTPFSFFERQSELRIARKGGATRARHTYAFFFFNIRHASEIPFPLFSNNKDTIFFNAIS